MNRHDLRWLYTILTLKVYLLLAAPLWGQPAGTLFYEGFEQPLNGLPAGWLNESLQGEEGWLAGVGAGEFTSGQSGIPDTAAAGQQNVYFRVPSANQYITRLITPAIEAGGAAHPELSFWHAQVPRNGNHSRLKVYYAESLTGPYTLLAEFPNPVYSWTHRIVQLPSGLSTLYLAFEGHSGGGTPGSVCVDEVLVTENNEVAAYLASVTSLQPTTALIATGTSNNPVLKTELRVIGNTGSVTLEEFTAVSLNTDDQDLAPKGVRLWFTAGELFDDPVLLGTAQDFVNGRVLFGNLSHPMPTGYSWLWVTYDIDGQATQGHLADAFLPAGGLTASGSQYPAQDQDPLGTREIRKKLFSDDFETDRGWTLTGEWQRATPLGLGGAQGGTSPTEGPADPLQATSGTQVLGTDLTGLGTWPGNYEPNLGTAAWQAIMPVQDFTQYNNITLSFRRWLNVYFFARATIDFSTDGGQTWQNVWTNNLVNNASGWSAVSYPLTAAARHPQVLIRFTLGDTGGTNLQSGWNIDDVVITGTFVAKDAGVTQWVAPLSGCGLTAQEPVTVMVTNHGTEPITAPVPMAFSTDGGSTWKHDTLYETIAAGAAVPFTFAPTAGFSTPGRYNQVLAKTLLPGDQDPNNDQLQTSIFSIPILKPPVTEGFEQGDAFWTGAGTQSTWRRAMPSATIIHNAPEGSYAWVTNPVGYHNASEHSWVESPCLDFSGIENPVLDFMLNTNTYQGIDGMAVDYSTDGGTTWKRLMPRSPQLAWNWYNHGGIYALNTLTGNGQGWTGNSPGWINPRIVLPEETGHHPSVKLRMVFASNPVEIAYEGVAFDRVAIYATPDDLALTAITAPGDACTHSTTETMTVEVTNVGINTLPEGRTIRVGIDDHTTGLSHQEEFALTAELAPGQKVLHTFSVTFDLQQQGSYPFTAFVVEDNNGFWGDGSNNSLKDTIHTFGLPQITLGDDLFTTRADTLVLDPGAGFAGYLWQDGSEQPTYAVTNPASAMYQVTVTDTNGCQATDSISIKTWDLEVTALLSPTGGCQPAEGSGVQVSLRNNGHEPFAKGLQIPVRFRLDGLLMEDLTVVLAEELAAAATLEVEFVTRLDLSADHDYELRVEHDMEDAGPDNNQRTFIVESDGYPVVSLGDTIYTTNPAGVVLDPGPGYASYRWQDGSTLQTYPVSSPYSATYQVVVTNINGCSNSASVEVITRDAGLSALLAPGDACELSSSQQVSIRLFNHGVDAFGQGTVFELQLQVGPTILATEELTLQQQWLPGTPMDYTFTATADMQAAGTYPLTITLLSKDAGQANNSLSATVTVAGYPEPEVPARIVTSQPDTLVLDAGAGFASYLWSTGSTSQTQQVNTWGSLWVEVTNAAGCLARKAIVVEAEFMDLALSEIITPVNTCQEASADLVVKASLDNAGNMPLEAGQQITMRYRIEGHSPAEEVFTLQEDLQPGSRAPFTFNTRPGLLSPGTFAIRVWLEEASDQQATNNQMEQQVTIWPSPSPWLGEDIVTDRPDTLTLDAGAGFAAYLWHDGTTITPTFGVVQAGLHWVEVTDNNGCTGRDSLMVELKTGITHPSENMEVVVYPNPAGRQVTLRMNLREGQPVIIQLWNPQGTLVLSRRLQAQGLMEETFQLDHLAPGAYTFRILHNHRVTVRKLVVTGNKY